MNVRWALREIRAGAALQVCLALLVAILATTALAGPPLLDRWAGSALGQRVTRAQEDGPLLVHSTTASPPMQDAFFDDTGQGDDPMSAGVLADQLNRVSRAIRDKAPEPLRGRLRPGPVSIELPSAALPVPVGADSARASRLSLLYASDAPGAPSYTQGRPPGKAPALDPKEKLPVEIAVSEATGRALGLTVGTRTKLSDRGFDADVVVVGIFRSAEGRSPVSRRQPSLDGPLQEEIGGVTIQHATALLDPTGMEVLQRRNRIDFTVIWRIKVDLPERAAVDTVVHGGLPALRRAAGRYQQNAELGLCETVRSDPFCAMGQNLVTPLQTVNQLTPVFDRFATQQVQARSLSSFAIAGLLAVALGTVAVAARLAVRRRRTADLLQRARGATALDVTRARLLEMAPAVLVGAAAGYGITRLLLPGSAALPYGYALAVTALAWAAVPLLTWISVREQAPRRRRGRSDGAGLAQNRRLLAEAAVVLVAVASVAALRSRGAGESAGGVDPQLAAVPVLLGLVAVMVLARLYPLPLRSLAARARRSRGPVGFLALARTGRAAAGHGLALLVLILTLATAVFGGLVADTVSQGREQAAAWNAGGDAVVVDNTPPPAESPGTATVGVDTGDDPAARTLSRIKGVERVVSVRQATASLAGATDGRFRDPVDLVGVDSAALQRAAPGSAAARALRDAEIGGSAAGPLPVLASADVAKAYAGKTLALGELRGATVSVRIVGALPAAAGRDPALGPVRADAHAPLLLADVRSLGALQPTDITHRALLLYGHDLDAAALRAAAQRTVGPTAQVVLHADELNRLRKDGLLTSVLDAYAVCGALGILLALLAVILELLLTADERARTAAYLRMLGLGGRPVALLHFLELLPLAVAAAVGGTALGLLLPAALGPALNLGEFTGGPTAPVLHTDYGLTTLLTLGLGALVLAAVAIDAVRGRRRNLGSVLRLGETLA
ncbi:hypothetical protein [Streptomyces beijiangensis]|uniref:ABC transport system permease protein n=1 Tax=Streptomyces beijiangensis TaxID=163361 RepID=A0A939F726_9ACTN|nr:hypothetical protein [Streptomyces beijiangensis]MBO0513262.1 hypothetical protein [Streptomyces beijiangensis]